MSTFDENIWRETCDRADSAKKERERRDLYDVLGVSRDATPEQLKKTFIKLVKKWHPDRNPDNKDESTEHFKEISEAYEILRDPEQRAAYDKYGFSARNLGATKQQRKEGNGSDGWEELLRALFEKIAEQLVRLARENADLFHDADSEPYAHAKVAGHRETYYVRGRPFSLWLRQLYFKKYKAGVNANSMAEALATITMFAVCEGPDVAAHTRIAEHSGAIYIDLGDKDWRAVRITAAGWEVVTDPPVRFVRSGSMRPLPLPMKGGSIESLRKFINVHPRDEASGADEFILLVAYVLAALRPNSNYPVLTLAGEQGSGKTSLVRLLGSLIDPRSPQLRSLPGNERDLIVAARHAHFISFDNISGLSDSMSDAICRLSTGGGHGERRLYTNEEEATFDGRRPVCLNGIEDVATRPELVDRSLMLLLVAIGPVSRRDEKDIDREFAEAAPEIFGALLDGLSAGLLNLTSVTIGDKPRMADFALWAEACTRAYWPAGTFMRAYLENIAAAVEVTIEASAVGDAVRRFMAGHQVWEGTASQLLALLTPLIPEALARERSWPKNARALSGKLRRAAPPLRRVGIEVEFGRRQPHTGERLILITMRGGEGGNFASPPSPPSPRPENARKDKGLDGDANGDASFAGDANDDAGDATVTQTTEPAPVDNPRKNNGFSQKGDEGDEGDANSAASSTSPAVFAKVTVREVWPPGLGPPGDDVFDINPQGWRR
jgi:energy-coupling factor transporter ATP-binding protein EcfA2